MKGGLLNIMKVNQEVCVLTLCSLPGAPSPESHLCTAGLRREAGQHGHPGPRGGAQHPALRAALPRGLQNAKAAYSHTA